MDTKVCTKCGVEKELVEFAIRKKGGAKGRKSWCKECVNRQARENTAKRLAENPPKVRFYNDTHAECLICGDIKTRSRFGINRALKAGVDGRCKDCVASTARGKRAKMTTEERCVYLKRQRKDYRRNIENIRKSAKASRLKHKDKVLAKEREYRKKNKEALRIKAAQKRAAMTEEQKIREREYARERRKDVRVRIATNMSNAVRYSLKKKGVSKNGYKWEGVVGYTSEALRNYLESLFEEGMSWDNYGKGGWHVDHIIPLYMFKFDSTEHENLKKAWSLDNLQPLWERDNLTKHKKLYWGDNATLDL